MPDAPRPSEEIRSGEGDGEASTPRWVYAVGLVLILVALVYVVMHLASGAGPLRHGA